MTTTFFGIGINFGIPKPKNRNGHEIVAVGAVDLSIGPFFTEFRCERFRDDAVFRNIENLAGSCRFGSSGSAVRAGSVRAGLPVRIGFCRFGSGGPAWFVANLL